MNIWMRLLVAGSSCVATVALAEEHRELGPHVHGHGTLNIAIEGGRVSIELDVPGMDIVGFEHTPSTDQQKATVAKGEAQLAKALELFKLPDAAGCNVADAEVAVEEPAAGNEPEEGREGHRDYNATYVLDCSQPSAITSIAFDYFNYFKAAHALTVNIVSEKSQNTYEVTTEKPVLTLGGTM